MAWQNAFLQFILSPFYSLPFVFKTILLRAVLTHIDYYNSEMH